MALQLVTTAPPAAEGDLEAWLEHLKTQGRRPATTTRYRSKVRAFLKTYPDTQFDQFTFDETMAFLNGLSDRERPMTASILRTWFRWGELTNRITDDPTRLLPKFKWTRAGPIREIFTDAEITKLEALPYPHGVLMEIIFETGIKTREAQTLTARCCELDGPEPRLRIIEGRFPRPIPITDEAFRYRLAHYITTEQLRPQDHLWWSRPGGARSVRRDKPINQGTIHRWWKEWLEHAGVPYRTLRTARNTFARRMRARGIDLGHLQLLMGNNDYYTTSEYYAEDRYPHTEQLVRSGAEAQADARALRELLNRAIPYLVAQDSRDANELAREIAAELTRLT